MWIRHGQSALENPKRGCKIFVKSGNDPSLETEANFEIGLSAKGIAEGAEPYIGRRGFGKAIC
jgi:hypothetical protein